jgi:hypothetical protein
VRIRKLLDWLNRLLEEFVFPTLKAAIAPVSIGLFVSRFRLEDIDDGKPRIVRVNKDR